MFSNLSLHIGLGWCMAVFGVRVRVMGELSQFGGLFVSTWDLSSTGQSALYFRQYPYHYLALTICIWSPILDDVFLRYNTLLR